MASLTNRYSEALFDVANSDGSAGAVADDCAVLEIALEERDMRLFLQNPQVSKQAKADLLQKVLSSGGRSPHAHTTRFLDVVLDRGRQEYLGEIARTYRARALDARGELEGVVETASELSSEDVARLAAGLGKIVGKKLVLSVKVDEALLGGFRVRVGDRMFDASLRSQLEALGQKLKGIPLTQMTREHGA